jgi:hypothetical protein
METKPVMLQRMAREILRQDLYTERRKKIKDPAKLKQFDRRHRSPEERGHRPPKNKDDLLRQLRHYRKFYCTVRDELEKLEVAPRPNQRYAKRLEDFIELAGRFNIPNAPKFPKDSITIRKLIAELDRLIRAGTNIKLTDGLTTVTLGNSGDDDLVTLDEAAAIVHRVKRTLERHLANMPAPFVQGGGGKASLWKWNELRPWLESEYVPDLPKRFPRNVR